MTFAVEWSEGRLKESKVLIQPWMRCMLYMKDEDSKEIDFQSETSSNSRVGKSVSPLPEKLSKKSTKLP